MNRSLLPQPRLAEPTLVPYWAESFIVLGRLGRVDHKLFQVLFKDKEGGVAINFPYFKHDAGVGAVATLPAGHDVAVELLGGTDGRLTSHLVKYTHRVDGRAHLSQEGKTRAGLAKQAVPLDAVNGHLFTVYLNGLAGFRRSDDKLGALTSTKRGGIIFGFGEQDPGWIQITGHRHGRHQALDRYRQYAVQGQVGPLVQSAEDDVQRALLAPWNNAQGGDTVLVLEARPLPAFPVETQPMLLFVGAFDAAAAVRDPEQATTMLAFQYPATDVEALRQGLERIHNHSAEAAESTIATA